MSNNRITNEHKDRDNDTRLGHKRCSESVLGNHQSGSSGGSDEVGANQQEAKQSILSQELNNHLHAPKRRIPLLLPVHGKPREAIGTKCQEFLARVSQNENRSLTRESRVLKAQKERALRVRAELESRARAEHKFQEAKVAFLMGSHERLGRRSPILILNHDSLLELMTRLSFV
jgi:hypothetical protein